MIGRVMKAAAGVPREEQASLGHTLSQAKARVWKEVGSGALAPLNPLDQEDATNPGAQRALAARLLAVAVEVEGDAPPAVRAWLEGLWAEAGLAV